MTARRCAPRRAHVKKSSPKKQTFFQNTPKPLFFKGSFVEIYVDEPDTLQAAWNRFDAERVQLTRDGGDTTHANAACAAIAGALRDIHDAPVVTA